MPSERRTVSVVVRGRVQGVYYRGWTVGQATALGLDGWVRNRTDGTVEAVFSGPPEAVARILELAADGPPDARVESVETREEQGAPPAGFRQLPTA